MMKEEDFVWALEKAVLDAMDKVTYESLQPFATAKSGWHDVELDDFLPAIRKQARRVYNRQVREVYNPQVK